MLQRTSCPYFWHIIMLKHESLPPLRVSIKHFIVSISQLVEVAMQCPTTLLPAAAPTYLTKATTFILTYTY